MIKKILILILVAGFILGGVVFSNIFESSNEAKVFDININYLENLVVKDGDKFLATTLSESPDVLKEKLIETNFVQLELDKYPLFEKPFFITYDDKNSKIYAVNRDDRSISKISFDASYKNPIVEKFISIPTNNSIKDIYVLDISYDNEKIYISSVNKKSKNDDCYYLILYVYDLNTKVWKDIFKSNPCIAKGAFHTLGGRIAHNSENIYLSGGNYFAFEWFPYTFDNPTNISNKDNNNSAFSKLISSTNFFGSIVQINKKTNISKKISYGHRNPGGLFWDKYRNILWETEHGPRGGDELNIIKKDKNYGWPNVSYGKSYGTRYRKEFLVDFKTKYNTHFGFEQPSFSWMPSIGISQLGVIKSNGKFSQYWNNNDLIISSLKDKSLYRTRIKNQNVAYSERIHIGERIRSLVVSEDIIFISADNGSLITIRPSENPLTEGSFP